METLHVLPSGMFVRKGKRRRVFIYVLIDPRDGEIRYVGQTFTPRVRWRQHCSKAKSTMPELDAWRHELLCAGLEPRMEIVGVVYGLTGICHIDEPIADGAERGVIRRLSRRTGERLINKSGR